jgi:hypothetical protein
MSLKIIVPSSRYVFVRQLHGAALPLPEVKVGTLYVE